MRSATSFVAGLVAFVAALVTVPLLWVSTHVADEDGYVRLSSQLATDEGLQTAFAGFLADDYVQRGLLPSSLEDTAAAALTAAAQLTTNQPGFVEAWETSQRSLHRSAFGEGSGPLTIDLDPLAAFVADRVGDRLPVSLQVPDDLTVTVGTAQDRARIHRVGQSTTFGLLGLMVVVAAAAVSIVSARSRPLALAGLGLGAVVAAGALRLATAVVTPRLVDHAEASTELARRMQRLLLDRVSDSLAGWLVWVAVAGAAAVVVGLVGRAVAGAPGHKA